MVFIGILHAWGKAQNGHKAMRHVLLIKTLPWILNWKIIVRPSMIEKKERQRKHIIVIENAPVLHEWLHRSMNYGNNIPFSFEYQAIFSLFASAE